MGDALLQYPFLGTFPHQVPVHQHVMLAATDEAFSFGLIGGYLGAGEVLDELLPPIGSRRSTVSTSCSAGGFLELPSLP